MHVYLLGHGALDRSLWWWMEVEGKLRYHLDGRRLPAIKDGDIVAIPVYVGMGRDSDLVPAWKVAVEELERQGRGRPRIMAFPEFQTTLRYWRLRHPISSASPEMMLGRGEVAAYLAGRAAHAGHAWHRVVPDPSLRSFLAQVLKSLRNGATLPTRVARTLEAQAFRAGYEGRAKQPWEQVAIQAGLDNDSVRYIAQKVAGFKNSPYLTDSPFRAHIVELERRMPEARRGPKSPRSGR